MQPHVDVPDIDSIYRLQIQRELQTAIAIFTAILAFVGLVAALSSRRHQQPVECFRLTDLRLQRPSGIGNNKRLTNKRDHSSARGKGFQIDSSMLNDKLSQTLACSPATKGSRTVRRSTSGDNILTAGGSSPGVGDASYAHSTGGAMAAALRHSRSEGELLRSVYCSAPLDAVNRATFLLEAFAFDMQAVLRSENSSSRESSEWPSTQFREEGASYNSSMTGTGSD